MGTYNYTITDSNNCSYTNSVILTESYLLFLQQIKMIASCFGYSDGNVSLVISGGIPNYNEDWGSNNPLNLPTGNYNYTIIDNNGCTFFRLCIYK